MMIGALRWTLASRGVRTRLSKAMMRHGLSSKCQLAYALHYVRARIESCMWMSSLTTINETLDLAETQHTFGVVLGAVKPCLDQ